ncbi:hypothetical protein OA174_06385 [Actinomycetota bacterium]|nr:hypothetical protein [Actinomycetota bacterium]
MRRVVQAMSLTMIIALLCACGSDTETTSDESEDQASSQASPDEVTATRESEPTHPEEKMVVDEPKEPQQPPSVTLLNASSVEDDVLLSWVDLAEQQMDTRVSNVLMLVYDVGEPIEPPQEIPETEASVHGRVLDDGQIDSLMADFEAWLEADACMSQDAGYRAEESMIYRRYLEEGGDASHMRALCPQTRVVGIGLTDSLRNEEPASVTELLVLHELYHAFQQDLEQEGECRAAGDAEDSTTRWLVEGGAHYFSTMLLNDLDQEKARQVIYEQARQSLNESDGLREEAPDRKGAAALLLMIDKGMTTHESVMDGSLFHECAREFRFGNSNPEISLVEQEWSQF